MSADPDVTRLRDLLVAERLRAMRSRDRASVVACRTALSALDNAEATPIDPERHRAGAIEASAVGVGAAEVARRDLTAAEAESIVRSEIAEREAAAAEVAGPAPERAGALRAEAAVLQAILARFAEPAGE